MKTFYFKFLCSGCNEVFGASCNTPIDKDFTGFIIGFMCDKCYYQTKLRLEDLS